MRLGNCLTFVTRLLDDSLDQVGWKQTGHGVEVHGRHGERHVRAGSGLGRGEGSL